jgi:CRISPR-associated protein Cmr1
VEVRIADVRLKGTNQPQENIAAEYKAQEDWFADHYQRLAVLDRQVAQLQRNNAPENQIRQAREQRNAAKQVLQDRYSQSRYFDLRDPRWLDVEGSYVLWTAGATDKSRLAVRWKPNVVTFNLTLLGPESELTVLRNVVRAWILFGGYGSRTRRGLGSLTVTGTDPKNEKRDEAQQRAKWLPAAEVEDDPETLRKAISTCFGWDLFQQDERPTQEPNTSPRFANAAMLVPLPDPNDLNIDYVGVSATDAWVESLGWLRSFRQGTDKEGAREGTFTNPGVSNWPEGDKIRHLAHKWTGHKPRHNGNPAFPRAGFGLPIGMKFKPGDGDPEGQFDILWRSSHGNHERLASALILKPLPLANGRFLPMALWLNRSDPTGSKVYVDGYEQAAVDFNVLVAAGDTPQHSGAVAEALKSRSTLRDAFVAYLEKRGVRRIAP